ncbi:hypothetical protein [Streptomyces sp. NPDC049881]|uniref:hypothetical protein n=1 Tax=Streptomyces sp. NPDC049881 TaxID=3155778 RepID=UPI003446FF47
MAGRRAPRAVQAREKARARTAERRAREQQLEDLATGWFAAEDEIAEIDSSTRQKVEAYAAKVRADAEKETGRLRNTMAGIVAQMLTLERVRSVAGRLGVPEAEVRTVKAATEVPVPAPAAEGREKAAPS